MTYHVKTADAANSKWRGVLMSLGVPDSYLNGKPGPCPFCGTGTDRFVFDNKQGRGSFICRSCGAGDGMEFAMKFTGQSFAEVAARVDSIIGNEKIGTDKPKPEMSDEDRRAAVLRVAKSAQAIQPGDLVDTYLRSRGLGDDHYPSALRFAPRLSDGEGGVRPCMVASVREPGGRAVTLHRTFLRPDGKAKAEMGEKARKLMPGGLPDGGAIRLGEFIGGPLGIAEGIETAMSAAMLYELPVWAVLNAGNMEKFMPPEGCDQFVIFGDHDRNHRGQAAAEICAHRVSMKLPDLAVVVRIPPNVGDDWNDVLMQSRVSEPA